MGSLVRAQPGEQKRLKASQKCEAFFCNTTQAYQIEKHIKNMKSANYIRNFLKYPEIADKLFSKKLNRFYVGSSDKFITLDTIHKKANLNDWLYFHL